MQIKKWDLSKDYSIISKWCKDRKWDLAIPKEMLPPLGIIISDKEKICAAGLYIDKKEIKVQDLSAMSKDELIKQINELKDEIPNAKTIQIEASEEEKLED